ncbi:MAG: Macrolide export ATP-binding/permease protein MacB [Acidobacteria bacterium]|nr:Macrolide export ATP-binding/permease protein MacB [Acidobacteriota bacterium]
MFIENLKIALRAISANKMRSLLTVLGVMIGVASVIAVVSLVQGLQYKISKDLEGIGSNYVEVFPDAGEERNPFLQKLPDLTIEDALAVRRAVGGIRTFTALFVTNAQSKFGDARHGAQMWAVNETYQEILNHWVEHGRFFTTLDEETKKRVAVVGPEVAAKLHLGNDAIGKVIQIDGAGYTVVGILEKKGGTLGQDRDDMILIPFATATTVYGPENMKKLVLAFQLRPGTDADLAKEQLTEVLRTRHHLKKGERDDFRILAQEELLKTVSSVLLNVSLIMAAVVGIALLVGGIGIMNIMLVSVTERTREIGIRKSIGARRRDILLQFLIEAIALSGLGGAIGVAGGYLLANLIRLGFKKFVDLPPVHTPLWAIVLAFLFCAILGTIFGIYPAAKASKLDPIEALRYE